MLKIINEMVNPSAYMTNFRIVRNHDDYNSSRTFTYQVLSDSDRFGKQAISYESYKLENCADWICQVCEFYMEYFDVNTKEYKESKVTYDKFKKRPVNVDTDYIESEFVDEFKETEENIVKAVKKVTSILNIDLSPKMFDFDTGKNLSLRVDKPRTIIAGTYSSLTNMITLCNDAENDTDTIIHEIGHYIHHRYFGNQRYKWSTNNRTNYSFTNNCEAFAEIFTQFINKPNSNILNIVKMKSLLNDLNLLKY